MKKKRKPSIIYIPDKNEHNFMEIQSGSIAPKILYRSSSPIKGGEEAKKIKSDLAVKAGIKCVINLDDHSSLIHDLSKDVAWYRELLEKEKVICLPLTFTIPGNSHNQENLRTAFRFMITHEGPYLIHCFAGVDRTGFVSALLEALMGACLKEICKNYLSASSVDNNSICRIDIYRKMKNFLSQIKKMAHGENLSSINIQNAAERYLLKNVWFSQEEISKLKNILSGTGSKTGVNENGLRCY
jgi:protein tyrosine/serine phosphatase